GDTPVSTCVIVRGELVFMAEKSQRRTSNLTLVHRFLQDIRTYGVDEETADIYGQFKADILRRFGPKEKSKLRRAKIEGLGISENDLWIAAIALRNGLTIVSADSDFQRMREVRAFQLESWWSARSTSST